MKMIKDITTKMREFADTDSQTMSRYMVSKLIRCFADDIEAIEAAKFETKGDAK